MTASNGRIASIDIVKVFAVLFVLNSHMGVCYGDLSFLATGGGIGDALFFFCSGFTLFLGRTDRFDNWYKRRFSRIYVSIMAVALVTAIIIGTSDTIGILSLQKYWFVRCILMYYVLLYPIKKYAKHMGLVFGCASIIVLAIYLLFFDYNNNGLIYGGVDKFRWYMFFLFMLQGAIVGKNWASITFKPYDILICIGCIGCWYGILYFLKSSQWQIISVIPLLGITYYLYKIACASIFTRMYDMKYLGNVLYCIASVCLESYIIQKYVITDRFNSLFPLNIPLVMLLVLISAYGLRIVTEFLIQTFDSKPYNWNKIFILKK